MYIIKSIFVSALLLITACGGSSSGSLTKSLGSFRLAQSCEEIRAYTREYARRVQENPGGVVPVLTDGIARNTPTSAEGSGPSNDAPTAGGAVLQSDIAFSDVERGLLYALTHDQKFKIFRVSPGQAVALVATLPLDFFPQEIVTLSSGEKFFAAVVGNRGGGIGVQPFPGAESIDSTDSFQEPQTVMVLFDVTDPNQPQELKRETAPGVFLEARALTQKGALIWVTERFVPIYLEELSDAQILAEKTVRSPQGEAAQPVVACERIYLYENNTLDSDYAPYSLNSVVVSLLNLQDPALPVNSQAIYSPAYRTLIAANPDRLFLAQNVDGLARADSELYQFDLLSGGTLSLSASASVPGNIPNQFFIDEKAGIVRVFHHLPQSFGGCFECFAEGPEPGVALLKSQTKLEVGNYLSTYQQSGTQLNLLGQTGPFETDEIPYAARFIGTLGCVITFRQIDPLTCFDLRNAASPLKLGELEIAGVSFHLEAISEQLLLGIGQGGTNGTVVANLFDIHDPAHPALAAQKVLSTGSDWATSPVFHDYRALGKDNALRNFAVPIETGNGTQLSLFSVTPETASLATLGTLVKNSSPSGSYDSYQRAFFFADTLAALSFEEMEVFLRSDLSEIFSAPLGN